MVTLRKKGTNQKTVEKRKKHMKESIPKTENADNHCRKVDSFATTEDKQQRKGSKTPPPSLVTVCGCIYSKK